MECCCFSFLISLEDLCSVDLFNSDARFDRVRFKALLSACKQLQKSGLLHSALHTQVSLYPESNDEYLYAIKSFSCVKGQ